MSEQTKDGTGQTNQPDPITNLKAEMNRKLENSNSELAAMKAQMAQLLSGKGQPQPEEDFDPYDPQAVRQAVKKTVDAGISAYKEEQNKFHQHEARKQQVILTLVNEYPELQNPGSELVQDARAILEKLPADEQNSSVAYKAAILEAAVNRGITPKSKRQSTSDDSFQLGGSKPNSGSKRGKDEMEPSVQAWMDALAPYTDSIDFKKPEVRARIKERSEARAKGRK